MPSICTRTITELREMIFSIPSCQRGYRWRDIQVEQLLNDLWGFFKDNGANPEAWYCMQPLVVAPKDNRLDAKSRSEHVFPCGHTVSAGRAADCDWTVIDGQQRLTTLFIILSQLGQKDVWQIKYETRERSGTFLQNLTPVQDADSSQESASNPDFFCMQKAANTVSQWLKRKNHAAIESAFAKCILNNAKFIWYETTEDPYDVFIRLNSGKISLSNAELIKALLLRETRFQDNEGTIKLQQLELAGEWDRIEQALGNDEFWYFINPDAKSPRFNATRIDFIFEIVLRKGFDGLKSAPADYLKEIDRNPYLGFATFAEYCKSNKSEIGSTHEVKIWAEIQSVFRRMKSWYDERSLYHYVGFLMNRKGEDAEKRITTLIDLLGDSQKETRSDFMKIVKQECGKAIINCKFDKLEYDKHNYKLNDVLLLFNLALLDRQNSEQSRYPFKTHTGTAWSLEHIHAKNERSLDDNDIAELKEAMGFDNDRTIEELNEQLVKSGVKIVPIDAAIKTGWKVICDEQETHGLENLALLERTHNSKFNNKLYPAKRRILSLWEKKVKDGDNKRSEELPAFIPLGTRMAFFKHFSPNKSVSFVWDASDSKAYFDTIVKMVANYVDVKEDELLSNNGGAQ